MPARSTPRQRAPHNGLVPDVHARSIELPIDEDCELFDVVEAIHDFDHALMDHLASEYLFWDGNPGRGSGPVDALRWSARFSGGTRITRAVGADVVTHAKDYELSAIEVEVVSYLVDRHRDDPEVIASVTSRWTTIKSNAIRVTVWSYAGASTADAVEAAMIRVARRCYPDRQDPREPVTHPLMAGLEALAAEDDSDSATDHTQLGDPQIDVEAHSMSQRAHAIDDAGPVASPTPPGKPPADAIPQVPPRQVWSTILKYFVLPLITTVLGGVAVWWIEGRFG